jgi:DNA-binding FadR family transcriptional regulator
MDAAYKGRLALEPVAARLAATRRTAADIKAMASAVRRHCTATGDVERAFAAAREFHLALVAASHNPYLERFDQMLWAGGLGRRIYESQRGSSSASQPMPTSTRRSPMLLRLKKPIMGSC